LRKYKNCFENLTKNVFTLSGELQNNILLNGPASYKKPEFKDSLEKKGQLRIPFKISKGIMS